MPTEIKIEVKKLCADAKLPAKATSDSACYDVYAVERTTVYAHGSAIIKTGLAFKLPEGYEMQIRPRSGLALKHGVTVCNSPGTIDADYRGEVQVLLINLGQKAFKIERGMRIAQLVIAPVVQAVFNKVYELPATMRGTGGFGHTGV